MGFNRKIREKIFVASARRCCVCKEFKGRNLEVHHIVQSSEGGDDTFENAIPLCFDCHANAGHFNSKHPRGTKFSPQELKMHRDKWYELVENGKFNISSSDYTQQYLLTNSFDIVVEIVNGDFKNFPLNEVKILQNNLRSYLKTIQYFSNKESKTTNYYKSFEDYSKKFEDTKKLKEEWGNVYYERVPTIEELKEKFNNSEFVVNYMLRNGASSKEIARVSFSEHGCGVGNYETYDFREAKVVFLSLINTSDKPKYLTAISENYIEDGGFIPLNQRSDSSEKKEINNLILEPGKCLLIPCCVMLLDLKNKYNAGVGFTFQQIGTGQMQDMRKVELSRDNTYLTIGPRHFVDSLYFEQEGLIEKVDIKKVDISNLLLTSRFWECGSCPHLYAKRIKSQKWEYIGELFSDMPDVYQIFNMELEDSLFESFKIVELENEITQISSISIDEMEIVSSLVLEKGDEFIFKVNCAKKLKISGKYSLIKGEKYVKDTKMKRQKIIYKLADMQ